MVTAWVKFSSNLGAKAHKLYSDDEWSRCERGYQTWWDALPKASAGVIPAGPLIYLKHRLHLPWANCGAGFSAR